LSALATLTRMRMQLALRNKAFYFFSTVMPLAFFFGYSALFAKGEPHAVSFFLGPVLALDVMGSFWGLSAALVTFREQGILRRFHVTPITSSDMLMSGVLASFVLILPVVVVQLILARYFYHVGSLGDLVSVFLLVGVGTISFGSMGLVIASVTNTMQETQILNQLLWLPLLFFSGATFPLLFLPKIVQKIALFLPATYLVSGLTDAIFRSASIWSVRIAVVSLAAWAILTFFVSAQLFRWEPEVKIPRKAKLFAAATVIPFILLGVWELHNGDLILKAQTNSQMLAKFQQIEKAMQKAAK
jgi:ABC-type multidrug transport system permease subunit